MCVAPAVECPFVGCTDDRSTLLVGRPGGSGAGVPGVAGVAPLRPPRQPASVIRPLARQACATCSRCASAVRRSLSRTGAAARCDEVARKVEEDGALWSIPGEAGLRTSRNVHLSARIAFCTRSEGASAFRIEERSARLVQPLTRDERRRPGSRTPRRGSVALGPRLRICRRGLGAGIADASVRAPWGARSACWVVLTQRSPPTSLKHRQTQASLMGMWPSTTARLVPGRSLRRVQHPGRHAGGPHAGSRSRRGWASLPLCCGAVSRADSAGQPPAMERGQR